MTDHYADCECKFCGPKKPPVADVCGHDSGPTHRWVVRDGVVYKVGARTGEQGELVYLLREPPLGDHLRDLIVVPVSEVRVQAGLSSERSSVFGGLPGVPSSAVEPGDYL